MKLKYHLETIDMSDEIIAVPVGQGSDQLQGILKLNQAGKEVLELLKNDTSEEEIIHQLSLKYENSAAYVRQTIAYLKDQNLIDD